MAEKKITFENALVELEVIVRNLESGSLTLDESLKQFERGVELTKLCLKTLENVEQKIMILAKEDGEITEKEFENKAEE